MANIFSFTRKFNMAQALFLAVLMIWLSWGSLMNALVGFIVYAHCFELFNSEVPTNLQRLIFGNKKDGK